MARWFAVLVAVAAVAACLVLLLGDRAAASCLALADHNSPAKAFRTAAKGAPASDADLCEGLALLAERKGAPAANKLSAAMAQAKPEDRWWVQGYYARALALMNRNEAAMRNWNEAIAAGAKSGNVDRVNIFRGDRGVLFGILKNYRAALAEFETVYRTTSYDEVRASVAYQALKAAVADENITQVERWYPLTFAATDKVGDAEHLAYATEVYGQMLDERERFDESAALYRKAIDATDGWGDEYWHAELYEFLGQSRFAADDHEGGVAAYTRAAALFRRAGEPEYAAQVERNIRARVARREIAAMDSF